MNTLRQLREKQGLAPEELARAAGITVEWYRDLETADAELDQNVSVRSVSRIASELGVNPSALYGGASAGAVSTYELASRIRTHLAQSGRSLEEFESQVGYAVGEALDEADKFGDFNADGLRAVSAAVNVNWFDVLDHLLDSGPPLDSQLTS
jgi:transcriptional regulator with XRE-family HTH domain